ncbi:MAG: nucleotide-binding protein [Anaerolineaceae bacterium]|nr:nucleotide-binding protein [Anaerolineaceae bacterium]
MADHSLLLITDTNIWIDLNHGMLLDIVFRLPYQICASDFARQEIRSVDVTELEKQGLIFLELEPSSVLELYELRQAKRVIAVADFAAYLLARQRSGILITGDRNLASFSESKNITVHGLLWLLDEMIHYELLGFTEAAHALDKILKMGARLPKLECEKRIRLWAGNL